MTKDGRDDWGRIRQVFEAALAQPAERRSAFVAEACRGEDATYDQVVALLESHKNAATFLETPAINLRGSVRPADLTGQRIGPYHIASLIGRGGMGDVYRARDTRLDRTVAIKVVAPQAADQAARDRFEREARAVAALNHPHICTVHDVGSHDGVDFLVMEFLEGETLSTRLLRGPLPPAQALDIAIQIASALDRAHKSGIVHRDLKPGNIMLTPSRAGSAASTQAKLLDFGLAKTTTAAIVGAQGGSEPSELTAPGTILGTLHYMAPEQLEGRPADARTDLFAFGCVLYEMVTGKKAFDARSSASLLSAIMVLTPTPVRELQPRVPPGVEYVVARCLEKDPDDRWQTARDLLAELRRTVGAAESAAVSTARPSAVRRLRWIAVPLVLATVIVGGWLTRSVWPRPDRAETVNWLSILPPPDGFDLSPDPIVSPDGRYVAFKAEDASHTALLWIKDLAGPIARPLAGTDGIGETESPFWSPDSRSIGFFAHSQLRRVDIDGGAPQVLAPAAESRGGTWSSSGVIIFDDGDGLLHRVSPSGGASPLVPGTAPGQRRLFPHALPDGRHYLFTSRNVNGLGQGIYVAALDSPDVRRVSDAWSKAVYASGHLIFGRQRALFAQPFDAVRLEVTGEPRQFADGLGTSCCTPLSFPFSASDRVLSFWSGANNSGAQLTWLARDGRRLEVAGEPGDTIGATLSPDGRRVVLERVDQKTASFDLWLLDLASGNRAARLTVDGNASSPVWSSDGTQLLVMYRARGLVAMPWRGGGLNEVVANPASMWPSDWSNDGRRVAFGDIRSGRWRLLTAPAVGNEKPTVYREGPFELGMMRFFPSGGWVAYISEESGQLEVYIDSFPTPGEKIRVSTNGGGWPTWRQDGKELYYLAPDRSLMAVAVRAEARALRASPPERLFEAPAVNPDQGRPQFAANADGSRFLFNARIEDKTPVGLTLITDWPALLAGRRSPR